MPAGRRRRAAATATEPSSARSRAQQRHARRKPQRLKRQRQAQAAADCCALGARRQTATAPPQHPDLSLTLSAFAESSHESANGKKTAKRPKGKDPILHFAPKPLKGLVNGNGNDNGTNGARRTAHGTAHGDARTQRTHNISGR